MGGTLRARPGSRSACAVAALAAVALLAGCGSGGASSGGAAGGSDGGTLKYRLSVDEGCMDPYQLQLRSSIGLSRQVVDSLAYQNVDGEVVPWLATSWEVNTDASQYTLQLRDGVTFSDGSTFGSEDVVATLDGIARMGALSIVGAPLLSGYEGATAADPRTVTVRFSRPNAAFLQALTTPSLGISAAEDWAKDPGTRCRESVVGTGPFVFRSYTPQESVSLVKRPEYAWAPQGFANQGAAHVDGIDVSFVTDPVVAVGQFQAGDLDVMSDLAGAALLQLPEGSAELWTRANPGVPMGLFLNPRGPLADRAVRTALNHALDRQTLVDTALSPYDEPATGLLSPVSRGATPAPELLAHDPEQAKRLLDAAGWQVGADGIRTKDGEPLSVDVLNPFGPNLAPVLDLAVQQAREVGIALRIVGVTLAEERQHQQARDFEARLNGSSRGDASVLTGFFRGLDPQIDALLDAQAAQPDPTARDATVATLSERILGEGYMVPIWPLKNPLVWQPTVAGLEFDNTNTPSFAGVTLGRS